MAVESSGVSLSANFFKKNFYKADTSVLRASARKTYTKNELSYEDSLALKRAVKRLGSYEKKEDNEGSIKSSVQAFLDVYNNTIDSTSGNSDKNISKYAKKLSRLSSKYADDLKDIGISVEKNGKLTANTYLLENADIDKVKEIFSKDHGFTSTVNNYAKQLGSKSYEAVYADLTGSGANLNIKL